MGARERRREPDWVHVRFLPLVLLLFLGATLLFARAVTPASHPPAARPRPQTASLAGPWTVKLDPAGTGAEHGFPQGRFTGKTVLLPYSPNARHVTGAPGERSYSGSVAWYRKAFTVPAAGDYAVAFGSVNHLATVWVDGREVARHTGTYLPFQARAQLARGRHVVVVRADWRDPDRMKAEGWHRTWFNFGGINRGVTLLRLGASELDSPGVVTRLDHGAAVVDVAVRVRNRGRRRTMRVGGRLGSAALAFTPAKLAAGGMRTVHARVRIAHPDLWAPGHPALYPLHLAVPGESALTTRVGLRELSWSGRRLRINGKPLRLRGASLQEDAPGRGDALTPADMDAVVARLEQLGANATRAQHPLNPALLDRLDAAGILVWQGVGQIDQPGHWSGDTRTALTRARRNVLQARAHPSVLSWMVVNEIDGNGASDAQRAYVRRVAAEIRALDPGRPIAVDVWGTHLPAVAGPVYDSIDLIGVTNYEGWYADLFQPGAVVSARIKAWLARLLRTFPSKPVVITEFGAEGDARNPASAPGGLGFQAALIARHIAVYRAEPRLSGMLVWNLQDFAMRPSFFGGSVRAETKAIRLRRGINEKGLFTYGGRPKPAARLVARLFSRPASRAAGG